MHGDEVMYHRRQPSTTIYNHQIFEMKVQQLFSLFWLHWKIVYDTCNPTFGGNSRYITDYMSNKKFRETLNFRKRRNIVIFPLTFLPGPKLDFSEFTKYTFKCLSCYLYSNLHLADQAIRCRNYFQKCSRMGKAAHLNSDFKRNVLI